MRHRHYFDHIDCQDEPLALDPVNRKLGGVCAGVARHMDVPACWVRAGAVIGLFILPGLTLLAYGLVWLILDKEA